MRLIRVLRAAAGADIFEHGATIAPHGGVVGGDQLYGHHAFQLISGEIPSSAPTMAQVFVFDGSAPGSPTALTWLDWRSGYSSRRIASCRYA